MKLIVNPEQRYAKMRAHTATHLLHAVLTEYFPNTKQAWSLVDSDVLRFDFYADSLLSTQQLREIEIKVNQYIYQSLPVELKETSFEEAQKLWAKAFFEEKYGDQVRVIRILKDNEMVSAELCGGTHVTNTKDIGAFAISSQEAVASGIKRITAITGPKVIEKLHTIEEILDQQVEALDIKSYAQIGEKTTKFLKEFDDMKSKLESMETQIIQNTLQSVEKKSNKDFEIIIQVDPTTNFKALWAIAKNIFSDKKSLLIFTKEGNYLILTDGSLSAKELAKQYNLKGGGSDISAQGRDLTVVNIS